MKKVTLSVVTFAAGATSLETTETSVRELILEETGLVSGGSGVVLGVTAKPAAPPRSGPPRFYGVAVANPPSSPGVNYPGIFGGVTVIGL